MIPKAALPHRVLLTGATRGIGKAVLLRLLERGCVVGAVGRNVNQLEELARAYPDKVFALPADLSDRAAVELLVPRAIMAMDGIDALVSCAGIAKHRPINELQTIDVEMQMNINWRAPFLLSRDVARHLMERSAEGCIVHVASTLAELPAKNTSIYASTKGAVISMTKAMAIELAPYGIRVNCVSPGGIDTDMIRGSRVLGENGAELSARPSLMPPSIPGGGPSLISIKPERHVEELRALHPLGRLGEPAEVADAIIYLLGAKFATGTILTLDGGLTAGR